MADEQADWNRQVIEEFRDNSGVVGGHFEGKRLVLLHHVGRRTGQERVNPLVAARDGDAYLICGSMGGGPKDPVWVGNIEAGPGRTTIEVDGDAPITVTTTVVRADSPEWPRLYGIWSAYWPDSKEYETHTDRRFPIIRLDPIG